MLNEMPATQVAPDSLGTTFAALADPTRRAILARLREGEAPVSALAEPFDISLPAISRHLKVLERAGLISRGRDARWRPCRLDAEPIKEVAAWADGYREFWEARFKKLDELLVELQEEDTDDGNDA
jgi:DNA-binding transcriptional ArsR family regulator